jgi:hypothetical protein
VVDEDEVVDEVVAEVVDEVMDDNAVDVEERFFNEEGDSSRFRLCFLDICFSSFEFNTGLLTPSGNLAAILVYNQ